MGVQDGPKLGPRRSQVTHNQSQGWGMEFGVGIKLFLVIGVGLLWKGFPAEKRSQRECWGGWDVSARDRHSAACI